MVQPRQLQLPTQRDPLARVALVALITKDGAIALPDESVEVTKR